jgi:hypothetical protein
LYRIILLCSQIRATQTISRRTVSIDRTCSMLGIVRPTKIILIRSGIWLGDKVTDRAMLNTLVGNVIMLPFKAIYARDRSRVADNTLMIQLECRYYRTQYIRLDNFDTLQLESY